MIAHAHHRSGRRRQTAHIVGQAGHAIGQAAQHRLGRGAAIGLAEIGERRLRAPGDAQPAGRADRDAARIGLLLQQQDRGARIMSLDGRHGARIAEADHDHVEGFARLAHR